MVIDLNEQYNGGFLPEFLLLAQAYCIWYIITTFFNDVLLYCLLFLLGLISRYGE